MDMNNVLDNVRFTSEDLLVLMGGFDRAHFACPFETCDPTNPKVVPWLEERRADVVRKYASLGLVDQTGAPAPEFARVLTPLRADGFSVSDGDQVAVGEEDSRTAVVYLAPDGTSTLVKRAPGRFGGFLLTQLKSAAEARSAVLALGGLEGRLVPNAPALSAAVPGDSDCDWIRALREGKRGDDEILRSVACSTGVDADRFIAAAETARAALKAERMTELHSIVAHAESALGGRLFDRFARKANVASSALYVVLDNRGIPEESYGSIGSGVGQWAWRSRTARVVPEAGFVYSVESMPEPGTPVDWSLNEALVARYDFGSFAFVENEGQLISVLFSHGDNPNLG